MFTSWSERRAQLTEARRRRDFDGGAFVADEAFDLLLELLVEDSDPPASVAALRRRLEAWPSADPGEEFTMWLLVHSALGAAFDHLHSRRQVSEITRRTRSLDAIAASRGAERSGLELASRGYAADDPGVRDLGAREMHAQAVVLAGEGSTPQQVQAVARALIRTIRDSFAAAVTRLCDDNDRHGLTRARYRSHVLDFLSHLGIPGIVEFSGESADTLRARYPRSGDRSTTKIPRFVEGLIPDDLRPFAVRFGRLFLLLRFALVPDREELALAAASEAELDAVVELFFATELSGTNDGWRDEDLRRAARTAGCVDVTAFVADVLFPTLERVVALRRRRSLERGELEAAPDDDDALRVALEVLLLGVPDGHALEAHLRGRFGADLDARRTFARSLGVEPSTLADLVLGRRWLRGDELRALTSAFGPQAEGVLMGLRPRLLAPIALDTPAPGDGDASGSLASKGPAS